MPTHKPLPLLAALLLTSLGNALIAADADNGPLAQQRGLQNFDAGNTRKLVIVKSPLPTVADALMKGNPSKVVDISPLHKQLDLKSRAYLLLQLKGHDWTIILNVTKDSVDPMKLAKSTAAYLKTRAVAYSYSDFSGATHYRLYDGPRELELIDAMDEDDAQLVLEHSGPGLDAETRQMLEAVKAGGGVRFRSTLRRLKSDERDDADAFVDRALKAENALVPDIGGLSLTPGNKWPLDDAPIPAADLQAIAFVTADPQPTTTPASQPNP